MQTEIMHDRDKIIETITDVLKKNNISKASLFGSFARNEAVINDIDLLIDNPQLTLFGLLKLEEELKNQSGYTFDIVEFSALKNSIRDSVLNEAISIL